MTYHEQRVLTSILRVMDEGKPMNPSSMTVKCPDCNGYKLYGYECQCKAAPKPAVVVEGGCQATLEDHIYVNGKCTACGQFTEVEELSAMLKLWNSLAPLDRGARWRALQWLLAKHEATK